MFEVDKIMTKDVMTVTPGAPIYHVANMLVEKKISGMPVVDKDNRVVGIISEKDVIRLLVSDNIGPNEQKVSDFMTKKVVAFAPEDSAVSVCEFFLSTPVRRVPIVKDGKLVGVVSRRDIIRLILKIRGKKE